MAIRAVLTPYHLKNGRLQRAAFKSPPNKDEVSVSRGTYVPATLVKAWAKLMVQQPHANPAKLYVGLAFVEVSEVRKAGSDVVDTRSEYLGHADIRHGIVALKGEPLPPQERLALDKRIDGIISASRFLRDDAPQAPIWR